MSFISKLVRRIIFPETYDAEAFVRILKTKYGMDIGDNCRVWSPNQVYIDKTRPHMLHIGNNVKITRNVTILCHDYSRSVVCGMEGYGNTGEAANTWIGDNVFIGVNATILMGARIGSNSIVGAGAVVSGRYEDGMVIAGNPARAICTIEQYYQKRKSREIEAARAYATAWKEKYGKWPDIYEMTNAFAWLYLPHTEESVEKYSRLFRLSGVDREQFVQTFLETEPAFDSFESFLGSCGR